jgi:hypothetical protein
VSRLVKTALACALAVALAACSQEPEPSPANDATPAATLVRCALGEMRQCPCVGSGFGVQACNALGSFDACSGCPATTGGAPAPSSAGASGGAGTPALAGSGAGASGSAPSTAGTGGASGSAAAGSSGDAGTVDAPAEAVPGTSCGEALPVLCALETEKCCVRSLRTDTCIPSGESCDCDLQNCSVLEVSCDGPEDCDSGQFCCGDLGGGSSYVSFQCAAQCQVTGNQRAACHQGEDTCPSNLICANSQLLSNLQICIDPATIEQ